MTQIDIGPPATEALTLIWLARRNKRTAKPCHTGFRYFAARVCEQLP